MTKPNPTSEADRLSEKSREDVENKRKKIYQSMSAEEKLAVATDLYYSALHLKQERLKSLHPEWTEEKIDRKTKEWMLYAKT
jgi:dephospho-CoA kinase